MFRLRTVAPIGFAFVATLLLATPQATAAVVFGLDTAISGVSPTGTPPYLKMTITQTAINEVEIQFDTSLGSNAFVSDIYFNFDPALLGSFSVTHLSGAVANSATLGSQNSVNFSGANSRFDANFSFNTANNGRLGSLTGNNNAFTSSTYRIQYTPNAVEQLTENSFSFLSSPVGGGGAYYFGAHMQGFPGGSAKWGQLNPPVMQVVPEPTSAAIFGAGFASLLGAMGLRRRRVIAE